jgi:Fe-S oxidoreductase
MVDRCSGFDGIWGLQKETYELSLKYGQKLFNGIEKAKPDLIVSDCPLSQLQIEKGIGKKAVHPILLIWEAYQA